VSALLIVPPHDTIVHEEAGSIAGQQLVLALCHTVWSLKEGEPVVYLLEPLVQVRCTHVAQDYVVVKHDLGLQWWQVTSFIYDLAGEDVQ
jgi:hypothetical protein